MAADLLLATYCGTAQHSETLVLKTLIVLSAAATLAAAQQPPAPTENGGHPVVSPDGNHIAFTSNRDGTPDLYVMNADGTGVVRLTRSPAEEAISGWNTDGTRLFYTIVSGDSAHTYSVAADGTGVTSVGTYAARTVLVSPDGQSVIYGAGPWATMQLFRERVDGTGSRRLTPGGGAYWCSSLTDNGTRVATSRSDSNGMQVWIFDASTDESWMATSFPKSDGNPQCPAWAPEGRRLALQSAAPVADSTKRDGHIWVLRLDTGAATKLAEHASPYLDEAPSWFPDGRRIAFQSNRTGRWEIWVMNYDGTGAHQITN